MSENADGRPREPPNKAESGPRGRDLTIPALLVPHVRVAASAMLGEAEALRALLDALPSEPYTAACVGLEHRPALLDALRERIDVQAGAAESALCEGAIEYAQLLARELVQLRSFAAAVARD